MDSLAAILNLAGGFSTSLDIVISKMNKVNSKLDKSNQKINKFNNSLKDTKRNVDQISDAFDGLYKSLNNFIELGNKLGFLNNINNNQKSQGKNDSKLQPNDILQDMLNIPFKSYSKGNSKKPSNKSSKMHSSKTVEMNPLMELIEEFLHQIKSDEKADLYEELIGKPLIEKIKGIPLIEKIKGIAKNGKYSKAAIKGIGFVGKKFILNIPGIILSGINIATAPKNKRGRVIAGEAGNWVGGAIAGAGVGAALGAFGLSPATVFIGSLIGGAAGAILGEKGTTAIYDNKKKIAKWFIKNKKSVAVGGIGALPGLINGNLFSAIGGGAHAIVGEKVSDAIYGKINNGRSFGVAIGGLFGSNVGRKVGSKVNGPVGGAIGGIIGSITGGNIVSAIYDNKNKFAKWFNKNKKSVAAGSIGIVNGLVNGDLFGAIGGGARAIVGEKVANVIYGKNKNSKGLRNKNNGRGFGEVIGGFLGSNVNGPVGGAIGGIIGGTVGGNIATTINKNKKKITKYVSNTLTNMWNIVKRILPNASKINKKALPDINYYNSNDFIPNYNSSLHKVNMKGEDVGRVRDTTKNNDKPRIVKLNPKITITFGDVHETADVNKIAKKLRSILKEEITIASEGAY